MLHNDDVVEEIATGRQGKIDAVDTLIEKGHQTAQRWRVYFTDGKEPLIKYFLKEGDLRVTRCPHIEPTEPRFVPSEPLM